MPQQSKNEALDALRGLLSVQILSQREPEYIEAVNRAQRAVAAELDLEHETAASAALTNRF